MIWLIVLTVLFIVLIGILLFIISNLYRQNEQFETYIKEAETREKQIFKEAENYYLAMLKLFTEAKQTIDAVDKRGSFSSDDEVGFAFKIIKIAIDNVANQLEELNKEQSESKEEKA